MVAQGLKYVYRGTMVLDAVAIMLSIRGIVNPYWIVSHVTEHGQHYDIMYGLVEKCSTSQSACRPFPEGIDCQANGSLFCTLWRTSSFFMWLSFVSQAASMFAYLNCVFAANRWVSQSGWKVISSLLAFTSLLQAFSTLTIATLLEKHPLFKTVRSSLGWCWAYATASWILTLIIITAVLIVGLMTPHDYEEFFDSDLETSDEGEENGEERDDYYYYRQETSRRYNYS